MCYYFYRCCHKHWLCILAIFFTVECIFNTVYYDTIIAVYKRAKTHDSNVSDIQQNRRLKKMFKYYSNITLSNSTAQDVTKKEINVNPLVNSTTVSMVSNDVSQILIVEKDGHVNESLKRNETIVQYKYPLITGMDVAMDYENGYNSSYDWFMNMKYLFKNIGKEEKSRYQKDAPKCRLDVDSLGPIKIIKTETNLEWIEQQNRDVKLGGYYAPAHCRALYRVAIIVSYRDRRANLAIFLRHIHPLLKTQLLEYRIFVVEQYGTEKFNKGTLYNIAFLETQRFGTWNCLIFHDVDLIPEDERISYSCPDYPTHMSPAVESFGYVLPYENIFGGVTALSPESYKMVNGYSNYYWDWGAEDDDFYNRLMSKNLPVLRYDSSIARYSALPHNCSKIAKERKLLLLLSKRRYQMEGLTTTKYKLLKVTKEKLYTHILAEVNPLKLKLDVRSVVQRVIRLFGNKKIVYQEMDLFNS